MAEDLEHDVQFDICQLFAKKIKSQENVEENAIQFLLKNIFDIVINKDNFDEKWEKLIDCLVFDFCLPILQTCCSSSNLNDTCLDFLLFSCSRDRRTYDLIVTKILKLLKDQYDTKKDETSVTGKSFWKTWLKLLKKLGENNEKLKNEVVLVLYELLCFDEIDEDLFIQVSSILKDFISTQNDGEKEGFLDVLQKLSHQSNKILLFALLALNTSIISREGIIEKLLIWEILQDGLTNSDPLTRKRALYIIKYLLGHVSSLKTFSSETDDALSIPIMHWSQEKNTELWDIWKSFIFVMETLEEKQIHVIRPMLPLLCQLYEESCHIQSEGLPLVHFSWFLRVIHRAISHESKQLIKWVLQYFLTLDFHRSSLFGADFLLDNVFESLKQAFLYVKEENTMVGQQPRIFGALKICFQNIMKYWDDEKLAHFIDKFFKRLTDEQFSDISCSYIIMALCSSNPKTMWLLPKHLQSIQQFTNCVRRSYKVEYQRIILQSLSDFCCQSLDVGKLSLEDIIMIFDINNKVCLSAVFSNWFLFIKQNQAVLKMKIESDRSIVRLIDEQECFTSLQLSQCLFIVQVEFLNEDESFLINKYISTFSDIIECSRRSPYYSNTKVYNMLVFLNYILKFSTICSKNSNVSELVNFCESMLLNLSKNILEYLLCKFTTFDESTEEIIYECFSFFNLILNVNYKANLQNRYQNMKLQICSKIEETLLLQIQKWTSISFEKKFFTMNFLKLLLLCKHDIKFTKEIFDIVCQEIKEINREEVHKYFKTKSFQKINSSIYLEFLWENVKNLYRILITRDNINNCAQKMFKNIFESFTNDITIVSIDEVLTLVQVTPFFIECFDESDEIESVCQTAWTVINSKSHNDRSFWDIYFAGVDTLFHKKIVLSQDENIQMNLKKYWKSLFEIGVNRSGIINRMVTNCLEAWIGINNNNSASSESLLRFSNEVVAIVTFGTSCQKHLKAHNDFVDFVKAMKSHDSLHSFHSPRELDHDVRISMLNFLLSLKSNEQTGNFVDKMLMLLINHDLNDYKMHKHMYYPNSERHRMKIRLWQTVLVLLSKASTSFDFESFTRRAFEALFYDNQPSVRRFIEWALVLICQIDNKSLEIFWDYFKTGSEKKIVTVVSVLTIAFHLSTLLNDEPFRNFCDCAIPLTIPWTQGQHMTSRIHAQITLKTIWEKVSSDSYLANKYSWVKYFFTLKESSSAAVKHRDVALKNFFFSTFHPIKHYSISSIFHEALSQTDVLSDEFIVTDKFINPYQSSQLVLKKWNEESVLLVKETEDDFPIVNVATPLVDMQKKIMPWSLVPSADDALLVSSELEKKRQSKISNLVVCAVLIDKTPNIGGLCRTCEIFGAEKLLVGSLRYLADSQFKALSVSAERWLNVEQVMPIKLGKYLEEMRSDGYTIVGVEQTANSSLINDYKFKEKTVLVLGNEKTGIPVDIIQAVDVCVEIPQAGIIRSLNVHTSGAILIWEYSKQHLFI